MVTSADVTTGRASYAVIGDPVEHSLSPRIFSRLFSELRIEGHYTALRVTPADLAEAIERVRFGALSGISVTMPHKETVLRHLDALHPTAARIGAVNCVGRSVDGRAIGYNTDSPGFRLALSERGRRLAAARLVLLGAGGAARAAAFAAATSGAKSVTIANRDPERAIRLGLDLVGSGHAWPEGELLRRWEEQEGAPKERAGPPRVRRLSSPSGKTFVSVVPLETQALLHPLSHASILVNATSVGQGDGEADPLPPGCVLHPALTTLDMVYDPLETALLRRARQAGAPAVDGLWMLIHQAFEQLRIWTGRAASPAIASDLHDRLSADFR